MGHRFAGIIAMCATVGCAVSGCYDGGGYGGGPYQGGSGPGGTVPATSITGSFQGSMGNVTSFTSDHAAVNVPTGAMSFRLDTPSDAPAWAMANVVLTEPLTSDAWAPGTTRTADIVGQSGDPAIAGAVGCSGPSYERWTFDHSASRAVVHVEQGTTPGSRLVTFAVYWDAEGSAPAQAVTGSFELPANSAR